MLRDLNVNYQNHLSCRFSMEIIWGLVVRTYSHHDVGWLGSLHAAWDDELWQLLPLKKEQNYPGLWLAPLTVP